MIRSPIKWSGGKFRARRKLLGLIPPHKCYVEVFGGAGWVLFGKQSSSVEIFNDIDGELINFFKIVKSKPKKLVGAFNLELVSRERFNYFRNVTAEELKTWTDVKRAHRFYYLIMASWGAEFGSPRFQTSVVDGGHGNRLIGALRTLEDRILPVYKRLQNVVIENLDWRECLEKYDRSYNKYKVVMYLDPPYPNNKVNYNHNMRSYEAHEELARACYKLKSRFLLTSYNLPEVRHLFSKNKFYFCELRFSGGMPNGKEGKNQNNEIIIANFELPKIVNGQKHL